MKTVDYIGHEEATEFSLSIMVASLRMLIRNEALSRNCRHPIRVVSTVKTYEKEKWHFDAYPVFYYTRIKKQEV